MSELITPKLADTRYDLENWAAGEYLVSLMLGEREKAIKAGKELVVLAGTEESYLQGLLGIMRFEIIDAALDFDMPFLDTNKLPVVGNTNQSCVAMVRASYASMRPGGVYDDSDIIELIDQGEMGTTVS